MPPPLLGLQPPDAKLALIENKLADLKAMRKALMALVRECDTSAALGACPIIEALAAE